MFDDVEVGTFLKIIETDNNFETRTCQECHYHLKANYRSGKRFYKCSLKKAGEKGRAVKAKQKACIAFKSGDGKEVWCESSYEC